MTTEPTGAPGGPEAVQTPPPLQPPAPARPITETRPEILVGAALAGGFIAAQILGRIRGR